MAAKYVQIICQRGSIGIFNALDASPCSYLVLLPYYPAGACSVAAIGICKMGLIEGLPPDVIVKIKNINVKDDDALAIGSFSLNQAWKIAGKFSMWESCCLFHLTLLHPAGYQVEKDQLVPGHLF